MSIILAFNLAPGAFTEEQLAPRPRPQSLPRARVARVDTDRAVGSEDPDQAPISGCAPAAHPFYRMAS